MMHKEDTVYIHNEILSHKNQYFAICSNMHGLRECYVKWNKTKKDNYYMIFTLFKDKYIKKIINTSFIHGTEKT